MKIVEFLIIFMVIMGIASVPSQYSIVQKLKNNGINASMFTFLPSDVIKFKRLLNNEINETARKEMRLIYWGYLLPFLLAISCFLLTITFLLLMSDN